MLKQRRRTPLISYNQFRAQFNCGATFVTLQGKFAYRARVDAHRPTSRWFRIKRWLVGGGEPHEKLLEF
jgi:hypothetical protein